MGLQKKKPGRFLLLIDHRDTLRPKGLGVEKIQ
jgi:hypothetical protein